MILYIKKNCTYLFPVFHCKKIHPLFNEGLHVFSCYCGDTLEKLKIQSFIHTYPVGIITNVWLYAYMFGFCLTFHTNWNNWCLSEYLHWRWTASCFPSCVTWTSAGRRWWPVTKACSAPGKSIKVSTISYLRIVPRICLSEAQHATTKPHQSN